MFLNRRHVPLILSLLFSIHYGKVLVVVVNAAALGKTRHKTPESREIFIQNETGRRIDVMWINRFVNPNTFHSNSPDEMGYAYGSSTGIDSFVGHEFEVRELPSKTTKQCLFGENACRKAHFQVSVEENQCMYKLFAVGVYVAVFFFFLTFFSPPPLPPSPSSLFFVFYLSFSSTCTHFSVHYT